MERRLTPKEMQSYLQDMRWPATRQQLKAQLLSQGIETTFLSALTDTSAADIQSEEEAFQELERIFHHP